MTLHDDALSAWAALGRESQVWWDDEHYLDNGHARVIIGRLLDKVDRLETLTHTVLHGEQMQVSYDGRLVPVTASGMREVIDDANRLREHATCPDTRLLNGICPCWRHGPGKSVDNPDEV